MFPLQRCSKASLAQLVEHALCKRTVMGSSPIGGCITWHPLPTRQRAASGQRRSLRHRRALSGLSGRASYDATRSQELWPVPMPMRVVMHGPAGSYSVSQILTNGSPKFLARFCFTRLNSVNFYIFRGACSIFDARKHCELSLSVG